MPLEYVHRLWKESLKADATEVAGPRAYRVKYTLPTDATCADVLTASAGGTSIPRVNQVDGSLKCKTVTVERDEDNPNFFDVDTDWSTKGDTESASTDGNAPKWNLDIEIGSLPVTEPRSKGTRIEGGTRTPNVPVCNSAGQPYDPAREDTYYDEEIRITFDTAFVDQRNIELCRKNYNKAAVTCSIKGYRRTFAAGTLKLIGTTLATSVGTDASPYWRLGYVFHWRKDGHTMKILDQGTEQLVGGVLVPIIVGQRETAKEHYLDGSGGVLPLGGTHVFREYDFSEPVSFAGLFAGL